jgi:hypothetical protein
MQLSNSSRSTRAAAAGFSAGGMGRSVATVLPHARQALLLAIVVLSVVAARPAAAQFSIGSPGEPPRLALGAGAWDITPSNRAGFATAGEFRGEYHFGDVLWAWSPFLGAEVTTSAGTYAYFGFGFDFNFTPNIVVTPNAAAGWFQPGSGSNLGFWWEFRTGAEFDYKFDDQSRLGVSFHHISNAGLGKVNPGEQEILLVYQIPIHW